ncbi:MAG: hypothetical protein VX617_01055, partial [Pseudomonadota bacterium]|nr:hypothetical protein [Pseudomonadota bacterium]
VAGGQLFLIFSLVAAEAAVVAPFGYFAIIVATVIGYQVFGNVPSLTTWIGMLIIVVSGIYIGVRETRTQNIQKRSLELKL